MHRVARTRWEGVSDTVTPTSKARDYLCLCPVCLSVFRFPNALPQPPDEGRADGMFGGGCVWETDPQMQNDSPNKIVL